MNTSNEVIKDLKEILASTYTLYLKTQNFHWNVTGHFFQTLHLMFEAQYQELALANDALAERIRALGDVAPGTYKQFSELSLVKENQSIPKADDMVAELVNDHETIIKASKKLIDKASEAGDEGTADLLTQRVGAQEKTVWMLKSFLDN